MYLFVTSVVFLFFVSIFSFQNILNDSGINDLDVTVQNTDNEEQKSFI